MGLRIKNLKSLKNLFFLGGEGWSRKPNIWGGGELPKKGGGAWTISRFRGGLGKKDGVVFLRGGG